MMMIAKQLKRLRLASGFTQEDLAERIGVTGQAVSKWERDECYPDITLLPGLANLFGVTVDELLGMEEMSSQERRNAIFMQAHELSAMGRYGEAVALMEDALGTLPDDYGLMSDLALNLALEGGKARLDRAILLCERVLAGCMRDKVRGTTHAALCFLYRQADMPEKAAQSARSLPHARESRELLLPIFLDQSERDVYLSEHLPGLLTAICALIDDSTTTNTEILRTNLLGVYDNPLPQPDALRRIAAFLEKNNA